MTKGAPTSAPLGSLNKEEREAGLEISEVNDVTLDKYECSFRIQRRWNVCIGLR